MTRQEREDAVEPAFPRRWPPRRSTTLILAASFALWGLILTGLLARAVLKIAQHLPPL